MAEVRILGIRHHGPGSARAVERALTALAPDIVLIEGAPELDEVVGLTGSESMIPPVAGFVYLRDQPRYAVFAPFASFSPEWIALRHATTHGVPVRFIDLPAAVTLQESADRPAEMQTSDQGQSPEPNIGQSNGIDEQPTDQRNELSNTEPNVGPNTDPNAGANREPNVGPNTDPNTDPNAGANQDFAPSFAQKAASDPFGLLAELAGYDDSEAWWEDVIEHRGVGGSITNGVSGSQDLPEHNPFEVFEAVTSAMAALRAGMQEADDQSAAPVKSAALSLHELREQRREAAMRQNIRLAIKEGYERFAVVCGAWHAPVLDPASFPKASADAALLKGLPKTKTVATWVPWTHRRLSSASGYGAGVQSPGWYHHLFEQRESTGSNAVTRWIVNVARMLREERLDASPASVIETVRLAETLATMRRRPLPGLSEINDASLAVLAQGSQITLDLIRDRLIIGERLGAVPEETPTVPLAKDLADQQKRLRLKVSAQSETVSLDLRKPNDLDKSHLFHRLSLLGIGWAVPALRQGRSTGTFHETWQTEWQPELAIAVVDAAMFGTTVETAAATKVIEDSASADLATLSAMVEAVLLAALNEVVSELVRALQTRVAEQSDVGSLMDAVGPLVRIARYGDVRNTDTDAVTGVLRGLLARICAGVGGACASLDDDAAQAMRGRIESVQQAVGLLDDEHQNNEWSVALSRIASMPSAHGLVAGRCVRLLRDAGFFTDDASGRLLSQALSRGTDAERGAQWIDGFLTGDASLLLHDTKLLGIIDDWVCTVSGPVFDDLMPLLRRTFSALSPVDRRHLAHRLFSGSPDSPTKPKSSIDEAQANAGLDVFLSWIGASS